MSGVGATFARTVTDGPLVVAALVAALVGLVSFLSPCVLPLVPGYLSYVTGLAGTQADHAPGESATGESATGESATGEGGAGEGGAGDGGVAVRTRPRTRGRTVAGAALFVLGFTALFVSFGAFFGGLGAAVARHQEVIERVLGGVVILLGLGFLGLIPGLQREFRMHRLPTAGLAGAPLLGVAFGLGWTPCVGPTLGAVQTLAYSTASAGRGALLSAAYCLGLGVPFLLVGAGFQWLVGALGAVRRHAAWVTYVGGALLVLLGVLLLTGQWDHLMNELRAWAGNTGLGTSL